MFRERSLRQQHVSASDTLAVHDHCNQCGPLLLCVAHVCVQLASDGFATSLSEDTLCRVLASDTLNVADELTLYHAVAIRAAQNQFR